jgi:hypothetical protein
MKLINASKTIYGQEVHVNTDGVRIGAEPGTGIVLIILGLTIAFLFVHPGLSIATFILGIVFAGINQSKQGDGFDKRKHYKWDEIEKFELVSSDIVSSKSGLGTVGGAVAGGFVFGGAGAIVGGMASGNNAKLHQTIAVKFKDGEWFVATLDNPALKDREFGLIQSKSMCNQDCPI